MSTPNVPIATQLRRHPRWALAIASALLAGAVLVGIVRASRDHPADPARATLVDASGLSDDQASCILDGAAASGVDVDALRQAIVEPGSGPALSAADQRAVNDIAQDCLTG